MSFRFNPATTATESYDPVFSLRFSNMQECGALMVHDIVARCHGERILKAEDALLNELQGNAFADAPTALRAALRVEQKRFDDAFRTGEDGSREIRFSRAEALIIRELSRKYVRMIGHGVTLLRRPFTKAELDDAADAIIESLDRQVIELDAISAGFIPSSLPTNP